MRLEGNGQREGPVCVGPFFTGHCNDFSFHSMIKWEVSAYGKSKSDILSFPFNKTPLAQTTAGP